MYELRSSRRKECSSINKVKGEEGQENLRLPLEQGSGPYFFFFFFAAFIGFIGTPQQTRSQGAHAQGSSTKTTTPHSSHLNRSPFETNFSITSSAYSESSRLLISDATFYLFANLCGFPGVVSYPARSPQCAEDELEIKVWRREWDLNPRGP